MSKSWRSLLGFWTRQEATPQITEPGETLSIQWVVNTLPHREPIFPSYPWVNATLFAGFLLIFALYGAYGIALQFKINVAPLKWPFLTVIFAALLCDVIYFIALLRDTFLLLTRPYSIRANRLDICHEHEQQVAAKIAANFSQHEIKKLSRRVDYEIKLEREGNVRRGLWRALQTALAALLPAFLLANPDPSKALSAMTPGDLNRYLLAFGLGATIGSLILHGFAQRLARVRHILSDAEQLSKAPHHANRHDDTMGLSSHPRSARKGAPSLAESSDARSSS